MLLIYSCCILGGLGLGVLLGQFSTSEKIDLEDYMDEEEQTEEIRQQDTNSFPADKIKSVTQKDVSRGHHFNGNFGQTLTLDGGKVHISVDQVNDGNMHFFNTTLPSGKRVYFFVLRSPDGKLRAAANGCQQCGRAMQGFSQSGDYVFCHTCGIQYHFNQVATQKGGCNPEPISADLPVRDGRVQIYLSQLTDIVPFFE